MNRREMLAMTMGALMPGGTPDSRVGEAGGINIPSYCPPAAWERLGGSGLIVPAADADLGLGVEGPQCHHTELGAAEILAGRGSIALEAFGDAFGMRDPDALRRAWGPTRKEAGMVMAPEWDMDFVFGEFLRRYEAGWWAFESMWMDKARIPEKDGPVRVFQSHLPDKNLITDRIPVQKFEEQGANLNGVVIPPLKLAAPYDCPDDERSKCYVAVRTFQGSVDMPGLGERDYGGTWACLVRNKYDEWRLLDGQVPAEDKAKYHDGTARVRHTSLFGLGGVRIDRGVRDPFREQSYGTLFTGLGFECHPERMEEGILCVRVTHELPLLFAMAAASAVKDKSLTRALQWWRSK